MTTVGRYARLMMAATVLASAALLAPSSSSASTPSLVNLLYYADLTYHTVGGGHDTHSYWIDYQGPNDQSYAVVIAVPAGLPQNFPFALPEMPKPHINPNDHSKAIIVGSLTPDERARVLAGIAPETRSAFFRLAASNTYLPHVDERSFTTKGMTVPVGAETNGSLWGVGYALLWGRGLQNTEEGPLPLQTTVVCGHGSGSSRALVFFELPGVSRFSLAEDGRSVIKNSALAHDPIQPVTASYALWVPQSTHNVKVTTVPASKSFSFNLVACENAD